MNDKLIKFIHKTIYFLCLLSIIVISIEVSANSGPPSTGGSTAGVPGGLEKIFILRETLTIDMRSLGELKSEQDEKIVWVEAVYEIENRGELKEQDLIFAIGSENVEEFQFWIDDNLIGDIEKQIHKNEAVWTNRIEQWNLPENWLPPNSTPWKKDESLDGNLDYYPEVISSILFKLTIPTGRHILRAKYRSRPGEYTAMPPLKAWQFAYILAPAREWAGFGGLNVTLYVPGNWDAVTAPELQREGDILKGSFEAIPADSLTITVRPKVPARYYILQYFYIVFFCLIVFAFPVFLVIYARRKGYKHKFAWVCGIILSLFWAVLFIFAGTFPFFTNWAYLIPASPYTAESQGWAYVFMLLIFISPILFILGLIFWITAIFYARKRELNK